MSRGVYGAPGDTTFRKTWNKDEYAAKAAERELKEKKESKERYEKKMGILKYEPTPDGKMIEARREKLNFEENLNKPMMVPSGASLPSKSGTKGKSAGFYCDICDVTYPDNLSFVDHLNSKQHLKVTGQSSRAEKATLENVRQRLEWLKEKKRAAQKEDEYDIEKRLREKRKIIEEERRLRKERRKIKRQGAASSDEEDDGDTDMKAMLGFAGFRTTKA